MRFKSINVWSKTTVVLRNESGHIVDLYVRLLGYYNNETCKQLNIFCEDNLDTICFEPRYVPNAPDYSGFPIIHMPFPYDEYYRMSDLEKSCFWLDFLHRAIEYVCEYWGWDRAPFLETEQKVREAGYINEYRWGKYIKSPSKTYTAYRWFRQDIHSAKFILRIRKGKNEVANALLDETEPRIYNYYNWPGILEWESDERLLLLDKRDRSIMREIRFVNEEIVLE